MKAMLLAAGRGERMMPLTADCPKPLLRIAGKPLIQYHIEKLAEAGFTELVINVAYLGEQIIETLGDGSVWGVRISYSKETAALETAGGIKQALPLLGGEPFLVVNSDIWTDWDYGEIVDRFKQSQMLHTTGAHLILVQNPPHHSGGDFILKPSGQIDLLMDQGLSYTFSGFGFYSADFFEMPQFKCGNKLALRALFDRAIESGSLTGEVKKGEWIDVGTPERLANLQKQHASASR